MCSWVQAWVGDWVVSSRFLVAASGLALKRKIIGGLEDKAKMIQADHGHLGVAEYGGPFSEAEADRDDEARALVKLARHQD